jgi:hypothetical protein
VSEQHHKIARGLAGTVTLLRQTLGIIKTLEELKPEIEKRVAQVDRLETEFLQGRYLHENPDPDVPTVAGEEAPA